ncbi:nuclear export mediator factor NEMF-like isoform X2 [Anneissia japonica]|uniref:nuclear export mediator factor NEMF-like isoform X2 n=1 Tax=Anneissia japonica TaxID=1529436 RepID=UPI00142566CD|nr:nuclear export mediator factor NEMF-like isoform X2 [Anneissia japonica]
MKSRFTTIDLRSVLSELGERLMGMRVLNVYDVDNKTYLIRLAKPDQKEVLLFESGSRIHSTTFEWPKNMMPSSFSMKLRKHLKSRRLVQIKQLGMDRIVDLQFGSDEAAYHLIIELYDRGNVVLTDFEFNILTLLRTRKEGEDVRFAVREKYPIETVKKPQPLIEMDRLQELIGGANPGDVLKRILNPNFVYGPAVIDHCLRGQGFPDNVKIGQGVDVNEDLPKIMEAIREAEKMMQDAGTVKQKGYIIQKKENKPASSGGEEAVILTYSEYHPFLYRQHEHLPHIVFDTFDQSVDDFYSKIGSQKLDMKALQQERAALKKLENVKKDHDKRIAQLQSNQDIDKRKAELIEVNLTLVDQAIQIVRSAIANQIDWSEIQNIIHEAQVQGDQVAMAIKSIKLDTNHITMSLRDPFDVIDEDDETGEGERNVPSSKPMKIDIDLGISAYANARKYFDLKKHSKMKETRTVESSSKAIKSAERKTKQALKEVATVTSIKKARKTYWFEKFFWFISSENYLVIAGRDQQQNELVVKKYLNPGDIYVHADLHGASSVIIKNISGQPVPPKTLQEAGVMAICYSVAWEARVITSAWWVRHDQVSKTAPTGEYLTTGSFMIRGKKNYLPPTHLMMGFGFMFKIDESSVFRHKDERKIRCGEDEESIATESVGDEEELKAPSIDDDGDEDDDEDEDASKSNKEEGQEGEKTIEEEEKLEVKEEAKKESSESDEESLFPDTAIQIQHIKGDKYELQRSRGLSILSNSSSHHSAGVDEEEDDFNIIYLGDDQPIVVGKKSVEEEQKSKQRLSARQRRELKKKASQQEIADEADDVEPPVKNEQVSKTKSQKQTQQQEPLKRGQKSKQKKIKAKYQDQDDEERQFKMELLASAGPPKDVKGKKGKKKQQQQKQSQQNQKHHKQLKKDDNNEGQQMLQGTVKEEQNTVENLTEKVQNLAVDEINDGEGQDDVVKPLVMKHTWNKDTKDAEDDDDEEDDENKNIQESGSILDSLTWQPHPDDLLLFALPVCAPYSCMQNFKFKVKLTPGTGKRGKAAKTAIHMFQSSREASTREKDLFKSVKDTDLSRNIPGKVKVSAPNLHKHKR